MLLFYYENPLLDVYKAWDARLLDASRECASNFTREGINWFFKTGFESSFETGFWNWFWNWVWNWFWNWLGGLVSLGGLRGFGGWNWKKVPKWKWKWPWAILRPYRCAAGKKTGKLYSFPVFPATPLPCFQTLEWHFDLTRCPLRAINLASCVACRSTDINGKFQVWPARLLGSTTLS